MEQEAYIQKTLDFLKDHKEVALATVQDNRPAIRVFQVMMIEGTSVFFATSPKKAVYKQLQENGAVELLGMHQDISVRITGDVVWDVTGEQAQHIYNINPVLPRLYSTWKDLVYFRLPISSFCFFDLLPDTPLVKVFELNR